VQLIISQTKLHSVIAQVQKVIDTFGYTRLETQIIQPADLFLTKAGDHIIQKLFTFERSGRQMALRPEFTASAAKFYAEQENTAVDIPVRWQFAGPIFEDTSHSNTIYQRYSIGAELIGWADLRADAEIVAIAAVSVQKIGISDIYINLGSVQFMRALLASYALDTRTQRFVIDHLFHLSKEGKGYVLERFDRLASGIPSPSSSPDTNASYNLPSLLGDAPAHALAGRTAADILRRMQGKSIRAASRSVLVAALEQLERLNEINASPEQALPQMRALLTHNQTDALASLDSLQALVTFLNHYGFTSDHIRLQPTLARDWNYYTGTVFEIQTHDGILVAGGGRYDELIRLFGTHVVPAVGMAIHMDGLATALSLNKTDDEQKIYLQSTAQNHETALWWATKFRKNGVLVTVVDATHPMPNSSSERIGWLQVTTKDSVLYQGQRFEKNDFDTLVTMLSRR